MDVEDFCSQLNDSLDLLVLCNPNNPTSTAVARKDMRKILDCALQYGISVMVDETYEEFTPEGSKISSIPLTNNYNNLIVLRGSQIFRRSRPAAGLCGNGKSGPAEIYQYQEKSLDYQQPGRDRRLHYVLR